MQPESSRRAFFRTFVGLNTGAAAARTAAVADPVAAPTPQLPTFQRRNLRPTSIPDVRCLED